MAEARPVSLSKRSSNMDHKVPYVDVIADAILSSPYRRLTAREIFQYVRGKYGPMKREETLRNTIRHTLSRYNVFRKVQRGRLKKPNWWTVDEDSLGPPGGGWPEHTAPSYAQAGDDERGWNEYTPNEQGQHFSSRAVSGHGGAVAGWACQQSGWLGPGHQPTDCGHYGMLAEDFKRAAMRPVSAAVLPIQPAGMIE